MARKKQPALLPELEPPSIPEIEKAADRLAELRSARMDMQESEAEAAEKLLALMHEHDLPFYEYDSRRVGVANLEKVRVRKRKGEEDEG